jgi:hypothetical protein
MPVIVEGTKALIIHALLLQVVVKVLEYIHHAGSVLDFLLNNFVHSRFVV